MHAFKTLHKLKKKFKILYTSVSSCNTIITHFTNTLVIFALTLISRPNPYWWIHVFSRKRIQRAIRRSVLQPICSTFWIHYSGYWWRSKVNILPLFYLFYNSDIFWTFLLFYCLLHYLMLFEFLLFWWFLLHWTPTKYTYFIGFRFMF